MSFRLRYIGPRGPGFIDELWVNLYVRVAHVFYEAEGRTNGEWEEAFDWIAERFPPQPNLKSMSLHEWDGVGWWMNDILFFTQDDQLAFEFRLRWC